MISMSSSNVRINDRDKMIFRFLFEQKVASQKSIFKRFFSEKDKSTMVKRLQKLSKERFIDKSGHNLKGRIQIYYSLLPNGFNTIRQDFVFDGLNPHFKSDSVEHDLELSEIKNELEDYKMVEKYYSENYLQNCSMEENPKRFLALKELNSDAAIWINTDYGRFLAVIEYERRKKSIGKYTKKFTDYYMKTEITVVFYICEGREIANLIAKVDKEVGQDFTAKIYTTMRENVPKNKRGLPFINSRGDIFTLK